jgi:hypothetical protein
LLDRPRPEGRRYSEVEVEQFEVGAIKVDVGSESSWCYAIANYMYNDCTWYCNGEQKG